MSLPTDLPIRIRSFEPRDLPICQRLYEEGLIGGRIAENDTGADMDDILSIYMNSPGNHFWVAEDETGEVIGMIGVQHYEEGTGEIRRLRVRKDRQRRGVGRRLVERALTFCDERGYMKVMLDTYMEYEPAVKLFEKFRFRHSRSRKIGEKELLYFYLDLYQRESKQE